MNLAIALSASLAARLAPAYEVHCPSFNDMTLAQQIEHGINDWCAEGLSGHPYFGRTAAEAESIRASHGGA